MNSALTKFSFLAGVAYFVCMAIAHYFSFKFPLLFVYYDTPFYAYQDKIIAFAVFAYIGLFWSAAHNRSVAPTAIFVLGVTVLGLASVNMSTALSSVMSADQSTLPYWLQTGGIAGYFVFLTVFYLRDGKSNSW